MGARESRGKVPSDVIKVIHPEAKVTKLNRSFGIRPRRSGSDPIGSYPGKT